MKAINLEEKLAAFSETWQPRVVGQFNGQPWSEENVCMSYCWWFGLSTQNRLYRGSTAMGGTPYG